MKTPFNWVGNKYNYMEKINDLVISKQYNKVIDMFMGSGNVILNLDVEAKQIIGNDKERLLPMLYKTIQESKGMFDLSELNYIITKWNNFSNKQDYYDFRDYWNIKYKRNQFDRGFIYETALLLKMCSNSMVRFNKQNEFNQGFRGLGNKQEFFQDSMKELIINGLNNLDQDLDYRNYKFTNQDAINIGFNKDDLLIIDPPYILRQDMYSQDFTIEHDDYLLKILENQPCDFIYFNYIEREDFLHSNLYNVLNYSKDLSIIELSNKTKSGQGSKEVKNIKEIMVTNIIKGENIKWD